MTKKTRQEAAAALWRTGSILVFVVALGSSLLTLDDLGLAWDEPFSIIAGRSYAGWLARPSFSGEAIDVHWRLNHEHPPLAKLAMGIAQMVMGDRAGLVLPSRLAVAVAFALLVELVFHFGGRHFGGLAGVMAALSLLCMPRVFGHAHLAALDVPMALAWLLAVAAFARAMTSGRTGWGIVAGLCLGLALLTKINAVFLPVVLVVWGVGWYGKRALWPLVWTLGGGAVVFFAGWPWLWLAPWAHVKGYLFPDWRVPLPVLYFGRVFADKAAPWHYPLVMTVTTIPVGILFLTIVGATDAVRRLRQQPMLALLVVNVVVGLGAFATPWLPKYDGVRLFLYVFPFLALLAGIGGQRCWRWVAQRKGARSRRPLLLAALLFGSQAGATALIHPHELSYYNALTCGLWGAERLGMEVSYWHDPVNREVFRWLNQRAQYGQVIAFYPVGERVVLTGPRRATDEPNDFYEWYYLDGRKRLRATRFDGKGHYDFVVLNARTAMLRGHTEAWRLWTRGAPIYEVRKLGVRLVAVFARE
ncbi:MAG: glycosyltransferase family 39 protein [Candidatus Brocadiae bacterium]|nr:glycosyltransferase family 39 protein [Candidatus Brocadiia bacterium]